MTDQVDLEQLRSLVEELMELKDPGNPVPDPAFQLNWNLKVAEWRGHTVAAFEEMNKMLARNSQATGQLSQDMTALERRLNEQSRDVERRLSARITEVQLRAAGMSAVVTILVTLVVQLLLPHLFK